MPSDFSWDYLRDHNDVMDDLTVSCVTAIEKAADTIKAAFAQHNKLYICGNGGSAADSQHLAAEFVSSGYPAISLTTDTSIITAIANDRSYDDIFQDQITAHGLLGDVLLAISTSGQSANIIRALVEADGIGLSTIALTGEVGVADNSLHSDIEIKVPSTNTQHIQEAHLVIEHLIWELVTKS